MNCGIIADARQAHAAWKARAASCRGLGDFHHIPGLFSHRAEWKKENWLRFYPLLWERTKSIFVPGRFSVMTFCQHHSIVGLGSQDIGPKCVLGRKQFVDFPRWEKTRSNPLSQKRTVETSHYITGLQVAPKLEP